MRTRIHVSLGVSDLDRSVAFYSTLFGAEPTKRREDYANFRLDEPALHLALVHAPGAPKKDTPEHFGVELFEDDDLAGWQRRLEEAGLSLRTEEQVTCCYAVADKFWAADPDGNEWEFWVRAAEAEAMRGEAMALEPGSSTCCIPATPAAGESCCEPPPA
jgi:catechol 2,3-dioxygenase-like lactoylglutathione lyase family enzyme